MRKLLTLLVFNFITIICFSASVDTVSIYSNSMKKNIKCVVITPDSYKNHADLRFPVVYLLHGAGGDFSNWISKVGSIKEAVDNYQMIIVCPDGLKPAGILIALLIQQ
jgi:S-formylglutathione hydrolase FrmB